MQSHFEIRRQSYKDNLQVSQLGFYGIKLFMNNIESILNRDISSSEDHCRCAVCKNQEDFRVLNRNICNIHFYRHQKKREGPPTKKDAVAKQVSQKAKFAPRKDEPQKVTGHRGKQTEKSKDGQSPSVFEHHAVSHSQRLKIVRGELLVPTAEPLQRREEQRVRLHGRNPADPFLKLAEISENPQNIRLRQTQIRRSSSHNQQASPYAVVARVSAQHRE